MFNYDNDRIKLSAGITRPPQYWNVKKQRVIERLDYLEHTKSTQN